MNLTGLSFQHYRHKRSGKVYLSLGQANTTVARGEKEWNGECQVYKDDDGNVYTRPITEFQEKFELCFPDVEVQFEQNLNLLDRLDVFPETKDQRTYRLYLTGLIATFGQLFPFLSTKVRLAIVGAFTLIEHQEAIAASGTKLDEEVQKTLVLLTRSQTATSLKAVFTGLKAEEMMTMAIMSTSLLVRELYFQYARSYPAAEMEKVHKELEVRTNRAMEMLGQLEQIGVTVVYPTFNLANITSLGELPRQEVVSEA